MWFCPCCGCLLKIQTNASLNTTRFSCGTCPYAAPIVTRVSKKLQLEPKQTTDVEGGEEAMKHADRTKEDCPKCGFDSAFFRQQQTRSADEPMTRFYTCEKCRHMWKEE